MKMLFLVFFISLSAHVVAQGFTPAQIQQLQRIGIKEQDLNEIDRFKDLKQILTYDKSQRDWKIASMGLSIAGSGMILLGGQLLYLKEGDEIGNKVAGAALVSFGCTFNFIALPFWTIGHHDLKKRNRLIRDLKF